MLTVQRKAGGVGCYAWREDASGRGLHKARLRGAHRDRHGCGRLKRGGALVACEAVNKRLVLHFLAYAR